MVLIYFVLVFHAKLFQLLGNGIGLRNRCAGSGRKPNWQRPGPVIVCGHEIRDPRDARCVPQVQLEELAQDHLAELAVFREDERVVDFLRWEETPLAYFLSDALHDPVAHGHEVERLKLPCRPQLLQGNRGEALLFWFLRVVVSDDEFIDHRRRNENNRIREPRADGLQRLPDNRPIIGEVEEDVGIND